MMKAGQLILLMAIIMLFTSSCEQRNRSDKARSIGNTSEILVIVENEQQWEGSIGKAIRARLGREQYGLNQSEPVFHLAHIGKSSLSDLLKKHRNLLVVEIDKSIPEAKIESKVDVWSKPQQIVQITAPDAEQFVRAFESNAELLEQKYSKTERDRILTVFRTSTNKKAMKNLKNGFDLKMTIPREFYPAKTEQGFMWVRKEVEKYGQGILIISEPYLDTAQFSNASIVSRLNRNMRQFVPGPTDGSFMKTDEVYVPPRSMVISDFITDYAVETTGLWQLENDFMGGPFLSYTFVDARNNTIVTLCGYVYQPNKRKRDLLRQLEAIMYSTEFI
jgi:hypothetical protein